MVAPVQHCSPLLNGALVCFFPLSCSPNYDITLLGHAGERIVNTVYNESVFEMNNMFLLYRNNFIIVATRIKVLRYSKHVDFIDV